MGRGMLKKIFVAFYFMSVFFISENAIAALGLPDNTARLGYSLSLTRLNVDDPEGNTQAAYALQPFKFIYTDWKRSGNRLWLELFYQDAVLKATDTDVGQRFKHQGVNLIVQKNLRINSAVRPWIGLGLGLSIADSKKRHTVDDEGYLLKSYPNRRNESFGMLLSVVNEWQISREWTVGGNFLHRVTLNQSIAESSLSAYFLIRY